LRTNLNFVTDRPANPLNYLSLKALCLAHVRPGLTPTLFTFYDKYAASKQTSTCLKSQ